MSEAVLQVDPAHYRLGHYVDRARWQSYWEQIEATLAVEPGSALCIGVGDDLVPIALEKAGVRVRRLDFDARIGSDLVGDVRDIGRLVAADSVDVVLCCQVLEHLPFEDFAPTLHAIYGVARRRVVLSLPYHHQRVASLALKLPKLPPLAFDWVLPRCWARWRFDGQHHWEVGARGYSRRRIERIADDIARQRRSFFARGNHYHLFLLLDK